MFKFLFNKLTNNQNEIPLLYIAFNKNKYRNKPENSCELHLHPLLNDDIIKWKMNEIVEYIRENYDMEEM